MKLHDLTLFVKCVYEKCGGSRRENRKYPHIIISTGFSHFAIKIRSTWSQSVSRLFIYKKQKVACVAPHTVKYWSLPSAGSPALWGTAPHSPGCLSGPAASSPTSPQCCTTSESHSAKCQMSMQLVSQIHAFLGLQQLQMRLFRICQ